MAASHSEGVLCLEGYSVRSPGSWQGGSWVSALLVRVLLDTFAWSCSVICCFVFFHGQDQLIRPLTCCGGFLEPTCQSSLLAFVALFALFAVLFAWFVLVLFGLCVLFGWFCFALFCFVLFRLTSVDVAWPVLHFWTPKEGYSAIVCVIRSISTTMCDDLARATEARDGKKKAFEAWEAPSRYLQRASVKASTLEATLKYLEEASKGLRRILRSPLRYLQSLWSPLKVP